MKYLHIWGFLLSLSVLASCRSQQLVNDQDKFRNTVLDLHTNQIMDNLIRIRKGLPIVQMEYIHITGTITQNANANVGGSQTYVKILGAITATLTNLFSFGLTGYQQNQLTVTGEPVTDPGVYYAYFEYMKDPSHLMETFEPPPPGAAIIVRCQESVSCGFPGQKPCPRNIYYWVPAQFQEEFSKLAVRAIAMRGGPLPSPDFEVAIKAVEQCTVISQDDEYRLLLKLDRSIPNGNGWMKAVIQNRLLVSPDDLTILARGDMPISQPDGFQIYSTDEIVISLSLNRLKAQNKLEQSKTINNVIEDLLKNKTVNIRLEYFVPGPSSSASTLEDIRSQLELSRLNQQAK